MKLTNYQKAIAALMITALGYALLSLSIRIMDKAFLPFTQIYLRVGFGFVFALLLFWKDISIQRLRKIKMKDWLVLLFMGTLGYGLAIGFGTLGVLQIKLLNATVLGSTIPLFVFLYSFFFLRHHVNKKLFLFVVVSIYGAAVLSTNTFMPLPQNFALGDLYMILFAAGIACYSVGRRFLSKSISNKEITVIVTFFAFVTTFLIALMMKETLNVHGFTSPLILLGLAMAITLNIASTQLENFAFEYIRPIIGTQILLLENLFALLFGYLIYHEIISVVEFIGAGIIIVSVLSSSFFSEKEDV